VSIQEAMAVVSQACAEFRGTLRDHERLQHALSVIAGALPAESAEDPRQHGTTKNDDRPSDGDTRS
jgi:hypothetical protein